MQNSFDETMAAYDRSGASRFWETAAAQEQARQIQADPTADSGQSMVDRALDSFAVVPNAVAGAASSIVNLGTAISNSMGTDFKSVDWTVRETEWMPQKLASDIGQFFIPYTGAVKAVGAVSKGAKAAGFAKTARVLDPKIEATIKSAKAAAQTGNATKMTLNLARAEKMAKEAALGFAVDYAAFEMNEERLSDLLVQVPGLEGLEDFIGHDEDDSVFEARLKNSVEGLFLGVVGDYLLGMHASRQAYKHALKGGRSEGEAVAAGVQALDHKMAEAAVRREAEYDQFIEDEMLDFHFPEGSGGEALADDMREARRHIDEATAAGMDIGPDGTARPRAKVEDAEGNVTELSDEATARLEAEAYDLGTPTHDDLRAKVADAEGNVTELSDEATARLEADADDLGTPTPEAPKELKPNLSEGRKMEYDQTTGKFTIGVDGPTRASVAQGTARATLAPLDDLEITPEMSGRDIWESIQEKMGRSDIPDNPRAVGPDGKPIPLPDDVSRHAGNLTARGDLLNDAQNARSLLRSYEDLYGSQNWTAKLTKEQRQSLVIHQMDLFGNLNGVQRRAFIQQVGAATTEELQKNTATMLAFGQISNDYTTKASKMVDDLLQHEDTPNSEQLRELAELFEALGESHQHFTDHKSIFGVGLRAQPEDVVKIKDRAINQAMDACGLKP